MACSFRSRRAGRPTGYTKMFAVLSLNTFLYRINPKVFTRMHFFETVHAAMRHPNGKGTFQRQRAAAVSRSAAEFGYRQVHRDGRRAGRLPPGGTERKGHAERPLDLRSAGHRFVNAGRKTRNCGDAGSRIFRARFRSDFYGCIPRSGPRTCDRAAAAGHTAATAFARTSSRCRGCPDR